MAQQQNVAPQQTELPKQNAERPNGGATVVVGCRLPFGYKLVTYVMKDDQEQGIGGNSRDIKVARKTGHEFRLNGNRIRVGQTPDWVIANGAGLTRGIPEEVWEAWLKDHKDEPIVKNGIIFAHHRDQEVRAMAKDFRKQATGLEPFNPRTDSDGHMTDPRRPKPPKGETVIGELSQADKDSEI